MNRSKCFIWVIRYIQGWYFWYLHKYGSIGGRVWTDNASPQVRFFASHEETTSEPSMPNPKSVDYDFVVSFGKE